MGKIKKKKALILGITGQDGSYLAEYLLKKNYIVHGIKRKSSSFNTSRIDHIYKDFHKSSNFRLHYGDLADSNSIVNVISKIKPNEIYNLGAQSHVGHSFEIPEYTAEVTGIGTLRVLEALKFLNLKKTKFYQASTSELFGEKPNKINSFNEKSLMVPKSPYGVAKLFSYYLNSSKKKNKLAVINIDDKYGAMIANQTKKNINLITYSTKNKDADFYLKKIIKLDSINRLIIKNKNKELILDTKLFGLYNFQNILASVGFSKNKGLKIEDIYSGVKLFKGAPGRLEQISEKNSNIFIDYAHTPDALKKSIISLKENFKNKKLLILFGCGGDRDKGKRSKMGKIAASLADNIIILSLIHI